MAVDKLKKRKYNSDRFKREGQAKPLQCEQFNMKGVKMEKVKKTIFVNTSFEGVHNYPSAPEGVEFLRTPHRHMFGVYIEVEVYHDDRELEFILLKRSVNNWIKNKQNEFGTWQMGAMSCEMVANWLIENVKEELPRGNERYIKAIVDEDGENGAVVEVIPTTKVDPKNPPCKKLELPLSRNLSFDEYQKNAYTNIQKHNNHQEEVMHWAVGLGEEAGETLSVIKHKYYGGGYDVIDLVGELGDTLWHIAALCEALGITMEDVALFNLAKLQHRYPNGEFDHARSAYRQEHDIEFKDSEVYKVLTRRITNGGGK